MLPDFRSMQGAFVEVYRRCGKHMERKAGEKAAKAAAEQGFRHVLVSSTIHWYWKNSSELCCYAFNKRLLKGRKKTFAAAFF